MKNRIPLLALVLIALSATQGILFLTPPAPRATNPSTPKHSATPVSSASALSPDPPNNLSWADGPDQFTTTFDAFPASKLSYQLSSNKTTLQLQYILNGTNMPNTTHNVGIVLFWTSTAACISSFGTVTSGSATGGGSPFLGPLSATINSCQSYTRQGITRILSGFDPGVLSLDSNGSGSLNLTISNLPSGTFQAEFYIRTGACACAVIIQSPGPTWGAADSTVFISTSQFTNLLAYGPPLIDPLGIALSHDGLKLFVTDYTADAVFSLPTAGGPPSILASGAPLVNTRGIAVSPDGSTLYIAGYGNDTIMSLPSTGGTPTTIASGAPFSAPHGIAVSPDGSTLYIADVNAGTVFSLPASGGTATSLASINSPSDVKLSPDGSKLFVTSLTSGVFEVPTAGGPTTLIVGAPNGLQTGSIALTPDGKTIYVHTADPTFNLPSTIFSIPTSGGILTPLLSGPPLSVAGFMTLSQNNNALYVVDEGYLDRYQTGPVGQPGRVLSLTFPTSCCNPPSGLVGWWPGEGNANDITGNNNGSLVNGASFAPGIVGQAFSLNGVNQYVDLGNNPSLQVSHGNFTVDTWVEFNALAGNGGTRPGDMSIMDKMTIAGPNVDGWRLGKQTNNQFWFCFGGGSTNGCTGGPPNTVASLTTASIGVWYNVVAVKSAGIIAIYIDGNLEGTTSLGPFTDTNSTDLLMGSYIREGSYLNGLVDEPELYNRPLTVSEIQSIFHAGSFGKCHCAADPSGLVSWWPLNGNARDVQGANSGTLVGSGSQFVQAEVGQGFQSGGPGSLVQVNDTASLNPTPELTIDAWISVRAVNSGTTFNMPIVYKGDQIGFDSATRYGFAIQGNPGSGGFGPCTGTGTPGPGKLFFEFGDGTNCQQIDSNSTIPTGTFVHIAITVNASVVRIYVDGRVDAQANRVANLGTSSFPLQIGSIANNSDPGHFFNGTIDEVDLYNRALTASEVQSIFNAGSLGKCPPSFQGDVYVTNYGTDTVSVINGATNGLVATVNVGALPLWPAFDPSNNEVYVPNYGGNTVSVISASTNTVIANVTVGSNPHTAAFDSTNNNIYVSNWGSATVSIINGGTNSVTATVNVGSAPEGVVFDPFNNEVYVANSGGSTLSVISGLNNTVIGTVSVGYQPVGVALDSSNKDVYVANYGAGGGNTVSVINATNDVVATVNVGSAPVGVAFDPSNSRVYVTNYGSDSVSVIRDSDNTVIATVNVLVGPSGVAFSPANNELYVANSGEGGGVPNLSIINGATNTVVATLGVGAMPTGVAIAPVSTSILPGFDFTLSGSNFDETVLRGGAARYQVTLTKTTGTPGPVTLSVSGLPPGASTSFNNNPVIPSTVANVTINTSTTGGLGDYGLTITGNSGGFAHSVSVNLHIYDFNVTTSLCQQTVLRGGIAPFNLTFALVAGSSTVNLPPINITTTGLPLNTTIQITTLPPNPVPIQFITLSSTPVTVQVRLVTHANTSLGDFPFSMGGLDFRVPEGGSRLVNNCAGGFFQFHTFYVNIPWTCGIGVGGTVNGYINASLAPGSSIINLPPMTLQFTGLPTGSTVNTIFRTPPFIISCSSGFSLPGGYGGSFNLTIDGCFCGGGGGGGVVVVGGSPPGGQPGQSLVLHVYDFQIIVPPETMMRGQTIKFNVTIALLPGSSTVNLPTIYLNVSGLPLEVTGTLSPTSGTFAPLNGTLIGFTTLLTLQTSSATPLGNFTFNVIGNDTRPLLGGIRTGLGMLRVIPLGDVNGDGKVNIFDLVAVATAFGSHPGDPNWNPACDLNGDGIINIFDLVTVAANFGQGT